MGQFFPYFEESTIIEEIKKLSTEDLLDFWEEAHFLEEIWEDEEDFDYTDSYPFDHMLEYEKIVLHELQLRRCKGQL